MARKKPFIGFEFGAFVIGVSWRGRARLANVGKGWVICAHVHKSAVATVGVEECNDIRTNATAMDVATGFVEGGKAQHKCDAVDKAGDGVV